MIYLSRNISHKFPNAECKFEQKSDLIPWRKLRRDHNTLIGEIKFQIQTMNLRDHIWNGNCANTE